MYNRKLLAKFKKNYVNIVSISLTVLAKSFTNLEAKFMQ